MLLKGSKIRGIERPEVRQFNEKQNPKSKYYNQGLGTLLIFLIFV
jgi:hypothetical protein